MTEKSHKLHRAQRPLSLKTDVIRKRNRHDDGPARDRAATPKRMRSTAPVSADSPTAAANGRGRQADAAADSSARRTVPAAADAAAAIHPAPVDAEAGFLRWLPPTSASADPFPTAATAGDGSAFTSQEQGPDSAASPASAVVVPGEELVRMLMFRRDSLPWATSTATIARPGGGSNGSGGDGFFQPRHGESADLLLPRLPSLSGDDGAVTMYAAAAAPASLHRQLFRTPQSMSGGGGGFHANGDYVETSWHDGSGGGDYLGEHLGVDHGFDPEVCHAVLDAPLPSGVEIAALDSAFAATAAQPPMASAAAIPSIDTLLRLAAGTTARSHPRPPTPLPAVPAAAGGGLPPTFAPALFSRHAAAAGAPPGAPAALDGATLDYAAAAVAAGDDDLLMACWAGL
ncbi:hypothetical protein HK405_011415, partial [Cladochytrium tenue]